METKVCNHCGRELTLGNFYKKKDAPDGLQYAHPELASFSTRNLLEELKARGYTWEKMFAPRQEIDYRKI